MNRHWIDRHKSLFSFAASFYVWGSLSPGTNMARFLSGRYWELLPSHNPLAFGIAVGIVGVGLGIVYLPDLIVRLRRGSSRRMADRMMEAMNAQLLRTPARAPVMADSAIDTFFPGLSPASRTIGGAPDPLAMPTSPPATPVSPQPPPVVRLDAQQDPLRNDVRGVFGFLAKSIVELIRATELDVPRIGLTEPALCPSTRNRLSVNYLGVCFTASEANANRFLAEFEEVVRDVRIRIDLPPAISLTAYLEEYPRKTPADALRAYEAATQPQQLESNEEGPAAPDRITRLSHAGFIWESPSPMYLTWREIAAFTSVVRGARKARPSLPSSIPISATESGPLADLEDTLVRITRGQES